MSLSSTSTDAEWAAQILDNLDYKRVGSRDKAMLVAEACDALLLLRPTEITRGNRTITLESVKLIGDAASQWLDLHPATSGSSSGRTRYFSMENFRG